MKLKKDTIAMMGLIFIILFSVSTGALIGSVITSKHIKNQTLEFQEVTEYSDFLAIDYIINTSHQCMHIGFLYFRNNHTLMLTSEVPFLYVALYCMEEGYFIKYPVTMNLETIPYGFNISYLNLHTSLIFNNLNTKILRIYNISFWQVIK